MATDHSQNMDVFGKQELGWVVPRVLEPGPTATVTGWQDTKLDTAPDRLAAARRHAVHARRATASTTARRYVAKLPGRQIIDPAHRAVRRPRLVVARRATTSAARRPAATTSTSPCRSCARARRHDGDADVQVPLGHRVGLRLRLRHGDRPTAARTTVATRRPTATRRRRARTRTPTAARRSTATASPAPAARTTAGTAGRRPRPRQLPRRRVPRRPVRPLRVRRAAGRRCASATRPTGPRPAGLVHRRPGGQGRRRRRSTPPTSRRPTDPAIFNGGCREGLADGAATCTEGWQYVSAAEGSPADHAYYLEMRDRSGFDLDGQGEDDRDPTDVAPGCYLAYTDEAHGYGNVGTADPPAQSPLDSQPEPGERRRTSTTRRSPPPPATRLLRLRRGPRRQLLRPEREPTGTGGSPTTASLQRRSDVGRGRRSRGARTYDLTGNVTFTLGSGCGAFDYGWGDRGR